MTAAVATFALPDEDALASAAAVPLHELAPAAPPLAAVPPWVVVINAASGRQEGERIGEMILERVSARGVQVSIRVVTHAEEITQVAAQAAAQARERHGILVAVGGDGTLNALAAAAMESGAAFSVVPGGTFNYFGRSNGFPEVAEQAIDAVLHGRLQAIQVGRLNGRIFLVNASFGLYPQLLEDREQAKARFGRSRVTAWFAALMTLLGRHRRHRLLLQTADCERTLQASTVFVANNRLQLEHVGVPEAPAVDAGNLVGLVLQPVGRLGMVRLALQGALGRLGAADAVERLVFRRLQVMPGHWWRRRRVKVAVDGEQLRLRTPLVFDVAPTPLWLVAPTAAGEAAHA